MPKLNKALIDEAEEEGIALSCSSLAMDEDNGMYVAVPHIFLISC